MTPKQRLFVHEYLVDLNATQAAVRAGYSVRTANEQAVRLMQQPAIATAIQTAMDTRAEALRLKAEDVVRQLGRIAFCDIRDIFDAAGNVKEPGAWSDEAGAAIASILSRTRTMPDGSEIRTVKVTFGDKTAALNTITRHLGMFAADKVKVTMPRGGSGGVPVQIIIRPHAGATAMLEAKREQE